jgi:hypothetical protein
MRHFLLSLILGLQVGPGLSAQRLTLNHDKLADAPSQSVVNTTFDASFSALRNATKLRVMVSNKFNQRLLIELRQGRDDVLFTELITRQTRQYNRVFNLEELPIGSYSITISNGLQTIKRDLYIDPPYVRPVEPINNIVVVEDNF